MRYHPEALKKEVLAASMVQRQEYVKKVHTIFLNTKK